MAYTFRPLLTYIPQDADLHRLHKLLAGCLHALLNKGIPGAAGHTGKGLQLKVTPDRGYKGTRVDAACRFLMCQRL